jgi:hypothetical protein
MRPTGVVLIAIYHFLTAAVLLLVAVALVVGGGLLGTFLGSHFETRFGTGLGLTVGIIAAVFASGMAILAIFAGYGMWTMREWGRILNIALAAISLLFALPGLLVSLAHAHLFFFGGFLFGGFGLIRIMISGLIIWYLVQPNVVALFQRRSTAINPRS